MAPKKTIVKRTTRSTNTETRWVFFTDTRWVFFEPPPPPPAPPPAPPPPQEVAQDVQPILPYRQMASERP